MPPGNHEQPRPLALRTAMQRTGMAKMCLLKPPEGLQLLESNGPGGPIEAQRAVHRLCQRSKFRWGYHQLWSYGQCDNTKRTSCSVFTVVFVVVTSSSSSCSSTCCSVFSCLCWSFHLGGEASVPFHKCGGSDINNS